MHCPVNGGVLKCALLVSKNINKDKVTRVLLDKTINGSATGDHMS